MKRLKTLLVFSLLLVLTTGSAFAKKHKSADLSQDPELDLNGSLAFSTTAGYGIGFGGGAGLYFPLEDGFYLGGSAGFYSFNYSANTSLSYGGITGGAGASSTTNSLEVLVAGKYRFPGKSKFQPYLLGGAGISYLMVSSSAGSNVSSGGVSLNQTINTSSNTVNPMLTAGGGLEMSGGDNLDFFGQLKFSLVISTGGTTNVSGNTSMGSISGSISGGGGGTFLYIPLEVGIHFNL